MLQFLLPYIFCLYTLNSPIDVKESYPFSKWTEEVKEKCNTAKDATYMTTQEKEVIYLCNLARWDGKLFGETYLQQYIDSNGIAKNSYVTSLFSTLKKTKKIAPLKPAQDLFDSAEDHAVDSGKKGSIGHQNVKSRFKKYAPNYDETAENCDYGSDQALDIVMSLLIDEDVPDKGHRENILDKVFKSVGVAIREHKKYDWNCVMDFGDQ